MHIADMLSRAFLPTMDHPSGAEFENVNMAKFSEKLKDIQKVIKEDESLQMLKQTII